MSEIPSHEVMMPLEIAHSFLVHPSRGVEEPPTISGAALPTRGRVFDMLQEIFAKAEQECNIDIVFRLDENGEQNNPSRDRLVAYLARPGVPEGRAVAEGLQSVTTHRSGLGLLFLLKGKVGRDHHLIAARFPADQGVLAEENADRLTVEFIEKVFLRDARAYKSALFTTDSLAHGFWDGRAVDRQISGPRELSQYWISDFLQAELRTTGPAGTKRLAVALRSAIQRTADVEIRRELMSVADLVRTRHGRNVSAARIVRNLGMSEPAASLLRAAFPSPELMDETFRFDRDEFDRHVAFRVVELDNGGVLIAEAARFGEVFKREPLRVAEDRVRYTTEGKVVDDRLRKNK